MGSSLFCTIDNEGSYSFLSYIPVSFPSSSLRVFYLPFNLLTWFYVCGQVVEGFSTNKVTYEMYRIYYEDFI